jgi:prephenate dehydrogenase
MPAPGLELTGDITRIAKSDIVILSVPLVDFETVVSDIAPLIKPEQLVFDISSVKKPALDLMHQYIKCGIVLGIHPMFGPGASDLKGQNVILTPSGKVEEELAGRVKSYLEPRGAHVSIMEPEKHDEMMSIVLGLSHFIGLVSADMLTDPAINDNIVSFGGTTFKKIVELARGVISEDPVFYSYLQTNLPDLLRTYTVFQNRVDKWIDLIEQNNSEQIVHQMKYIRDQFVQRY